MINIIRTGEGREASTHVCMRIVFFRTAAAKEAKREKTSNNKMRRKKYICTKYARTFCECLRFGIFPGYFRYNIEMPERAYVRMIQIYMDGWWQTGRTRLADIHTFISRRRWGPRMYPPADFRRHSSSRQRPQRVRMYKKTKS